MAGNILVACIMVHVYRCVVIFRVMYVVGDTIIKQKFKQRQSRSTPKSTKMNKYHSPQFIDHKKRPRHMPND